MVNDDLEMRLRIRDQFRDCIQDFLERSYDEEELKNLKPYSPFESLDRWTVHKPSYAGDNGTGKWEDRIFLFLDSFHLNAWRSPNDESDGLDPILEIIFNEMLLQGRQLVKSPEEHRAGLLNSIFRLSEDSRIWDDHLRKAIWVRKLKSRRGKLNKSKSLPSFYKMAASRRKGKSNLAIKYTFCLSL